MVLIITLKTLTYALDYINLSDSVDMRILTLKISWVYGEVVNTIVSESNLCCGLAT